MATRPSRAEAKRIAATARAKAESVPLLTAKQTAHLASYVPEKVSSETWEAIRVTHGEVMRAAGIQGEESFQKRARELAHFLAGRHEAGQSIAVRDALTYEAIDYDYLHRATELSERSRNDRRSRLRKIAEVVNTGLAAQPRATPLGHQAVKPPYDRRDELAIMRVAARQRRPIPRRNLAAVVGFCGGAGADSVDLRHLRAKDTTDHGHEEGISVSFTRPRPREVWVRQEYEPLVRLALEGLRPNSLIIGKDVTRRNLVGAVVARAEILDDIPHIEASRLRSTWLAWLMTRAVPLSVILDAAGIRSARTLIDLLPHLPPSAPSGQHLRGGGDR